MTRFTCLFSYYGGKSKIARKYPSPEHDVVIEPFAGAASYSLHHLDRQVWINDADPITHSIWEFLLSPDCLAVAREMIPPRIEKGQKVSEVLPKESPMGMLRLLQSNANQGTQGATGIHDTVTTFGAKSINMTLRKLEYFVPRISHWKLTQLSYEDLIFDGNATWFVDPPYNNPAGDRYRLGSSGINYTHLGSWCRSRQGHVIVCENQGADWLPFEEFAPRQGVRSRYQKSEVKEVVWIRC